MSEKLAIELINASKTFRVRSKASETIQQRVFSVFSNQNVKKIKALKNINLKVNKGEFISIIGKNGSGKSTLIHLMSGIYPPDKGGNSKIYGSFIRLSLGMGFNPQMTAKQNIYINASLLGLPLKLIKEKVDEIIQFAEIEGFLDTQIKYYSTGMKARLAFSIAIHAKADIFLMDEFFGTVGDKDFRKKAKQIFDQSFVKDRTIIHASHNMEQVMKYADRVILLDKGEVLQIGKPKEVVERYINL